MSTDVRERLAREGGDYDLRAPDYDTQLIGPITDSIIDADRLARPCCVPALPCWELYRVAYAGDRLYAPELRRWCVSFAGAYCRAGGVRKDAYSEELACWVAWDAYALVCHGDVARAQELPPLSEIADMVGVDRKTYKRLRNTLTRLLLAALHDYWAELGVAIRRVKQAEHKVPFPKMAGRIGAGKGLGDVDLTGSGNYRAAPTADPDNL